MSDKDLINKYPWLAISDPYDEPDEEPISALTYIPDGWRNAFGAILCQEIDEAIKADGIENEFKIEQAKEKYGSLSIYYGPMGEHIDAVERKFRALSEAICVSCGSIENVKMVPFGWVSPYCRRCFKKIEGLSRMVEFDKLPNEELPYAISWRRFSKNGTEEFSDDISDTTAKIKTRYVIRQAAGEFKDEPFEEWEDNYYGA